MLQLLQMSSFNVITTFLLQFNTLGSSHYCSCPPCCVPASPGGPTHSKSVTFWDSQTCLSPLFNMIHPAPFADAALSPHPCLQTSYPPSAHFVSPPSASSPSFMFLAVLLYLLFTFSSLSCSCFFHGMPRVFWSATSNFSIVSRFILWI